ncbi:GPI mannosyltransferase 3, partial [Tremellales sp. Uapishka_1]
MYPSAFLLSLILRSHILFLPHTYFQPDEFYQALEPAHHLVFGEGHLTWEWRDLPSAGEGWWAELVIGGRMRSWIWPVVYAGLYRGLAALSLDETRLIVIAPRIVGVFVAALTDYYTARLASRLLGPGSSATALFLSFTSLFNAHLLPRALSTSPETLLTAMALSYFPFPDPQADVEDTNGSKGKTNTVANYIAMDRVEAKAANVKPLPPNLSLAFGLAALAICIRPTTLLFWLYLGSELLITAYRQDGIARCSSITLQATGSGSIVLAGSTILDYSVTGRWSLPLVTFIHQNLFLSVSTFYGSTSPLYHLTQSLPLMLFPIWCFFLRGFVAALLPRSLSPSSLATLDTPPGLKTLARALLVSIAGLSLSPHSEWRFLHPFLPPLLLFSIQPLCTGYAPTLPARYPFLQDMRQYTRMAKFPFYLILLAPIVPYLYLNTLHGRAQVEVMNVIRSGAVGQVDSLVVLAPCHSIPWSSHIHHPTDGWFLTCEPPLGSVSAPPFPIIYTLTVLLISDKNNTSAATQQSLFYDSPVSYLQIVFPFPPMPLHQVFNTDGTYLKPSHLILFGEILAKRETVEVGERGKGVMKSVSVQQALEELGYEPVWSGWNGFDLVQDEAERQGGVRIWREK